MEKGEIESSIHILSGLLGYSERVGLASDINAEIHCKDKNDCPARILRKAYEDGVKTAIEVLTNALQGGD